MNEGEFLGTNLEADWREVYDMSYFLNFSFFVWLTASPVNDLLILFGRMGTLTPTTWPSDNTPWMLSPKELSL